MVGPELTFFIIMGALAIFAAVMMLISENAVHSALFLILNLFSVAMLFLLLNASFLAMVQIVVYAGAIMILFIFVIMLLGSEKLLPEAEKPLQWLAPIAVGLVVAILLIASIAILQSEIDTSEPELHDPMVRVIHASSRAGALDVYLDDRQIAAGLKFEDDSEFEEWTEGEYTLQVFPQEGSDPLFSETVFLGEDDVVSLVILPEAIDGSSILRVEGSLDPVETRNTSNLTIVNAIPCGLVAETCGIDIADITDTGNDPSLINEQLVYGDVSSVTALNRDRYKNHTYILGAFEAGVVKETLANLTEDVNFAVEPITEIEDVEVTHNDSLLWVITVDTRAQSPRPQSFFLQIDNNPNFGSATGIGQLLLTTYLLPFEIISLLLLVAMVGTIVLTKEAGLARRRNVRRMANVPGAPSVDDYLRASKKGELPPPAAPKALPGGLPKQLPSESSGD
jgi:NADH:ubiquinone oxidoreductase subunit 6 (subunit J)